MLFSEHNPTAGSSSVACVADAPRGSIEGVDRLHGLFALLLLMGELGCTSVCEGGGLVNEGGSVQRLTFTLANPDTQNLGSGAMYDAGGFLPLVEGITRQHCVAQC